MVSSSNHLESFGSTYHLEVAPCGELLKPFRVERNKQKEKLREKLKKIRDAIPKPARSKASKKIAALLFQLKEFRQAKKIALYSAIGSEVNTELIFKKAIALGKKVFYPRVVLSHASVIPASAPTDGAGIQNKKSGFCLPRLRTSGAGSARNDNHLIFYRVQNLKKDLVLGTYGILEPRTNLTPRPLPIELMIVPGIAFDRKGYRLGYGKGYYDRILKKNKKIFSVGLSYHKTLLPSLSPESSECPVQCIITEKEIYRAKKN